MYAKGRSIDGATQRRILDEVLGRAATSGRGGVLAFDLDSTLLDNRPRQAQILREFGAAHGVAELAACGPEHWTSWDIADALRAAGLDERRVSALTPDAKRFWRERFFTSDYCAHDRAIAGATEFLAALRSTGVRIAYVTGRHEAMRDGSVVSFQQAGYPIPDGDSVHFLLKPTFELSDDDWKREAYARLDGIGRLVAAFDNEPAHINGYSARFPEALAVHLATDDSGRPIPLAQGIPSIADFVR